MLAGCAGLPGISCGCVACLDDCAVNAELILVRSSTADADALEGQSGGSELRSGFVRTEVHLQRCCRIGIGIRIRIGIRISAAACADSCKSDCHTVCVCFFLRSRFVSYIGFGRIVKECHIERNGRNTAFTEGGNVHYADTGRFNIRSCHAESRKRNGDVVESILSLVMSFCQEVYPFGRIAGEVSGLVACIAVAVDTVDVRTEEAVLILEGDAAFFEVGDAFCVAEIACAVCLEESRLTNAGLGAEAHHCVDRSRRTDFQTPYISAACHIALGHISCFAFAEVEEKHLRNIAVPRFAVVADRIALSRIYHVSHIDELPAEIEVGVIPCCIERISIVYRSFVRASEDTGIVVCNALRNDHAVFEVGRRADGNTFAALLTVRIGSVILGKLCSCGGRSCLNDILFRISKGKALGGRADRLCADRHG